MQHWKADDYLYNVHIITAKILGNTFEVVFILYI